MPHEKLDKGVVLYFGPESLNRAGDKGEVSGPGAACGRCFMLLKDISKCSVVAKDGTKDTTVSPQHGVCGIYGGGVPMTSKDHPPMPVYSRSEVGYYEGSGVPTHCGNCKHFHLGGLCEKVEGVVQQHGCCNQWEENPIASIQDKTFEELGV